MGEIDDLLRREQAAGELHSEGRFTVNLFRSRELLSRFRFAEPRFYALKLVQAAIARGASYLDVRASRHLEFRFDGPPLQADELRRISEPGQERWLAHLDAALCALWALHPEQIRIQSTELDWRVDRQGLEHLEERTLEGQPNYIEVELPKGGFFTRPWSQEKALLTERCQHAAIPVLLDEEPVNRLQARPKALMGWRVELGPAPAHRHAGVLLLPERQEHELPAAPSASQKWVTTLLDRPETGPDAWAAAARIPALLSDAHPCSSSLAQVHSSKHSWSQAVFVCDGVSLEPEANLLERPGYQALISAQGLTLDLTGLQLVHNGAFRARMEQVKALVRALDG